MEKTASEAIKYRRSVRRFDKDLEIDDNIVKKCIENAVLAPTSSNLQLWEFYHITNNNLIKNIAKSCFNQPAARTAKQLVITVVRRDLWRDRAKDNIKFQESNKESMSEREYKLVMKYYKTVIPLVYNNFLGILSYIKYLYAWFIGLFRVIFRQLRKSDMRIAAHKSAGLASQNFMISMAGYNYDTCPMEGFDSIRIKKILNLSKSSEINMIIGCGIRSSKGVYGKRFRIPFEKVYKKR